MRCTIVLIKPDFIILSSLHIQFADKYRYTEDLLVDRPKGLFWGFAWVLKIYVKRNILLNSTFFKKNSFYLLNPSFFNEANEVVFRSFALILNKIGKRYYNARGKSISLILNKIRGKNFVKSTLSGCIIEKVGNSIKISKENNEKL